MGVVRLILCFEVGVGSWGLDGQGGCSFGFVWSVSGVF